MPRLHRKVWLWWGKWWAIQLYANRYISLGIHVDFARPYVDLHLGWLILSAGRRAVITNAIDRHRHTCRGLLFEEPPL